MFEIVREESVKVYLHMDNRIVQQNPLCVEFSVTDEFSISPRLSPTMFDPDAISLLCTAVDSMRRNHWFEIVEESVMVCTKEMSSRTFHAQHPVSHVQREY